MGKLGRGRVPQDIRDRVAEGGVDTRWVLGTSLTKGDYVLGFAFSDAGYPPNRNTRFSTRREVMKVTSDYVHLRGQSPKPASRYYLVEGRK